MNLAICLLALALPWPQDDPVVSVGSGVTPPRVLSKTNPKYTKEAEAAFIQGTGLYTLIVDKTGHARDIRTLSPIGYGLDEKGEEAIGKWVFAPAMKDGLPVSTRAQIEVSFRFAGQPFDRKRESRRTDYNLAIHDIRNQEKQQKTVDTIRRLAQEKYLPAVYLLGSWTLRGEYVAQDIPRGVEMIVRAADKNLGPAVFELGMLYNNGEHVEKDESHGLKLLREASMLGSVGAQWELGQRYESGKSVQADEERARYYFRLCAAQGIAPCQFHLGRLLIEKPAGGYSDNVQAAAWLELAAEARVPGAQTAAAAASARLDAEQVDQVKRLKPQLVRKGR